MSEPTSMNTRVERAVNDLQDDFERQGGCLYRNQVERLLEKRKFAPSECIQVIEHLKALGINVTRLPEHAPSPVPNPQASSEDSEYQSEAYADQERSKISQNELFYEFQQLTAHFDLKKKGEFLNQQQEIVCIRQVRLYKRLLEDLGEDEFEKTPDFKSIAKDGQEAQKRLIVSNIRFVIKLSKQFMGISSLTLRDLVQEGIAGIIRAIEKFDETQYENRFQTYAVWWVKQSIMKAITEQGPMIRFPFSMVAEMGKYRRAFKLLLSNHPETFPTISEIADELGWEKERVGFISELCSFEFNSVKPSPDGSGDESLVDCLEDRSNGPYEVVSIRNVKDLINKALGDLNERERTVIEWCFGLADGEYETTLRDIGAKFNLSHERVRQIRESVLKKLRKSLGPYFGDTALKKAIAAFKPVENSEERLREIRLRKAATKTNEINQNARAPEAERGNNDN